MKEKGTFIKIILEVARLLFGFTFIFSGIVKAIDPYGFSYKIEDYLISFHLVQFIPLALTFALILILLEFLLGVFVFIGLYRKSSTIFGVLFMSVMTPLTLYIALQNPVEDCGCFGDALIISNWNTFFKNIILSFFAIILYIFHKQITPFYLNKSKKYVLAFVFIFSLIFCFYNIYYLPVIDFRPYKIGANLPEQMQVDFTDGDIYENKYVYEKEGIVKEFSEDNYPWEDTTWIFVELKAKLIKEGQKPIIEDFAITDINKDADGKYFKNDNITNEVLSYPYTLLVVSSTLERANLKAMTKVLTLVEYCNENKIDLRIVTSSDVTVVQKWTEKLGALNLNYAAMDERTLKTIVRSNPGLVLLKEGIIQEKWSKNKLPNVSELKEVLTQLHSEQNETPFKNSRFKLLIIFLIFTVPLIGFKIYDRKVNGQYKYNK